MSDETFKAPTLEPSAAEPPALAAPAPAAPALAAPALAAPALAAPALTPEQAAIAQQNELSDAASAEADDALGAFSELGEAVARLKQLTSMLP